MAANLGIKINDGDVAGVAYEVEADSDGEIEVEPLLHTRVRQGNHHGRQPNELSMRRCLLTYLTPKPNYKGQVDFTKSEEALVTYVTPELLNQEQSCRVELPGRYPDELQRILDEIKRSLNTETNDCRLCFTNGELKPCGSMAEGTKVMHADEFDFQYLINVEGLRATHTDLLRTKPRRSNRHSLSYFKLTISDSWGRTSNMRASDIHDEFLGRVEAAVRPLAYQELEVMKAGPAVKVSYLDPRGRRMKLDLTLGLKTEARSMSNLSEFATSLLDGTSDFPGIELKGHFVAAQDYWKLCFVETEQELVRRVIEEDPVKGAVYRSIKLLRDDADVKNIYGDGILPSYPIKVTFLDIARREFDAPWDLRDVGLQIIRILREVEYRGSSNTLYSLFLEEDDETAEGDRSYLESRRVLKELKLREKASESNARQTLLLALSFAPILGFQLYCSLIGNPYSEPSWYQLLTVIYSMILTANFIFVSPLIRQVFSTNMFFRLYPLAPIFLLVLLLNAFAFWVVRILRPFNIIDERHSHAVAQFTNQFGIWLIACMAIFCIVLRVINSIHKRTMRPSSSSLLILYDIPPILSFRWKPPHGDALIFLPEPEWADISMVDRGIGIFMAIFLVGFTVYWLVRLVMIDL